MLSVTKLEVTITPCLAFEEFTILLFKLFILIRFHDGQFSSVTHSCLTLWPHGPQHARLPCPSPTPRSCSNSYPFSWWCHPTISSSVVPFSCLQSSPASGSFLMSLFFASGGQSIGVSALASVLPVNIQDRFPFRIDWFDLLAVQGTLKSLLQHQSLKASILRCSAFFMVQLSKVTDVDFSC